MKGSHYRIAPVVMVRQNVIVNFGAVTEKELNDLFVFIVYCPFECVISMEGRAVYITKCAGGYSSASIQ